jgi:hypothetical protein
LLSAGEAFQDRHPNGPIYNMILFQFC